MTRGSWPYHWRWKRQPFRKYLVLCFARYVIREL